MGREDRDDGFEMMAIIVHTLNRQDDISALAPQILGPLPLADDKRRRPTDKPKTSGQEKPRGRGRWRGRAERVGSVQARRKNEMKVFVLFLEFFWCFFVV